MYWSGDNRGGMESCFSLYNECSSFCDDTYMFRLANITSRVSKDVCEAWWHFGAGQRGEVFLIFGISLMIVALIWLKFGKLNLLKVLVVRMLYIN